MENSRRSISIFTTLSDSLSSSEKERKANSNSNSNSNSTKSLRNFEGGVVGLGIVAAMTSSTHTHDSLFSVSPNPRSNPISIVSSAKPAANFRGWGRRTAMEVDENSEGYTCVISHFTDNTFKKRVYFDDNLTSPVNDFVGSGSTNTGAACVLTNGVFSTSPLNIGDPAPTQFWSADFLTYCNLCKKQLHGVDIFIYRGERAFCSAECRETHIRNDDCQEKCKSGAMKSLDCSMSPCSGPPVYFAGIAAA